MTHARAVLALLGVLCLSSCGERAERGVESRPGTEPTSQVADYTVMYKGEVDAAERVELTPALDSIRLEEGYRFLGEVYPLEATGPYALIYTPVGGARSREVAIREVGSGTRIDSVYRTGIIETGEGVFTVLEISDVDGDGTADVVYCRWDTGSPRVEAATRTSTRWQVEELPARPECRA